MVFVRAGIAVAAFGLVMLVAPQLVIRFQQWSYPEEEIEASEWRVRVVRYVGIAFVAIGTVFFVGGREGWL